VAKLGKNGMKAVNEAGTGVIRHWTWLSS
jgi:hypothetical protein